MAKNRTRNYRISEKKVNYHDGSSKKWYLILERHHWFLWRPIKFWKKCFNDFRPAREVFLTTDKSLVESVFRDVSKVEEKIYGVSVIPRIIKNDKEFIELYDEEGKVCGCKYDFKETEFEVKYTCTALITGSTDHRLGLYKLKTWDELKLYIGALPKKR